jgi:hypothetical protein
MLVNLQTKLTKGSQTAASTFRRDNETQYWQLRTKTSQTVNNKGQTMNKKLRYLSELRGDPVSMKMKVISPELDLGQPHQL